MKHSIPLKRFEYSVPCSDTYANGMGSWDGDPFETHLPLLKVMIDFEKRSLYLEGRGPSENERVRVKATIASGFSINLSDPTYDELVFSMEGDFDDDKTINSCSGLLVLGKTISGNGSEAGEWYMTIYLYDDCDDEREIKLRLTMYPPSENAPFN